MMDDSLLAELQASSIGGDVHSPHRPVSHSSLYKQHKSGDASQEIRRKKFLDQQKSRRRNFQDYARCIVEGVVDETGEPEMEDLTSYDEVDVDPSDVPMEKDKPKKKKRRNPYSNQLMLSEWLVEMPQEFSEKWLMYVCPIGKRCLVISARGTTTAYERNGNIYKNFPSLLPGGCTKTNQQTRDNCILDCIYYDGTHTFYVLDIMCWGGHPVYDSDTEFRVFWKASKIRDNAESISKFSRTNPFTFIDIAPVPCTPESLTKILSSSWPVQVDGLLFIHKEAHYWTTRTPLAGWLKAHMLPEVLGLPVSQEFLACAPTMSDVTMEDADKGKAPRKKGKSRKAETKMDVSTVESVDDDSTQPQQAEN